MGPSNTARKSLDLRLLLERCHAGQWSIENLDWNLQPRPMTRDEEMMVVQYFKNMAGIERLAAAMFEAQARTADDAVIRSIFLSFAEDEQRHALVAERLASFYDVHHYQEYNVCRQLLDFSKSFHAALRYFSPAVANLYVTAGELLLDVALLRSLQDYVRDEMANRAMVLINRDESRHIVMDYHMMDYYASEAYRSQRRHVPGLSLRDRLKAVGSIITLLFHARPFLINVFLQPMQHLDPSGHRVKQVFRGLQLVVQNPRIARQPLQRFLSALRRLYDRPLIRTLFGPVIARVSGLPAELTGTLHTREEANRARNMGALEMAEEALALKSL